jgi:hypothetical protein
MFLQMYDTVLAGYHKKEIRALFENSILVELGIADRKAILDRVEKYQAAPDIFSTMYVSDLVGLELHCRDTLAQAGPSSSYKKSGAKMLENS